MVCCVSKLENIVIRALKAVADEAQLVLVEARTQVAKFLRKSIPSSKEI
jgi:hypothetical protein